MVVQGRVENGVVVIEGGTPLPEGAVVSVSYPSAPTAEQAKLTLEQQQSLLDEFRRLQNLPDENPGDEFDAADHDRGLYLDFASSHAL